ncbi:uncharacterized protein LOC130808325 [Amaranthus tricolor]|uniref:uncharacterized protein LOC130808325 n=1 Tax=Amaranthus tricolor TaxID=29722 RepID=UPI00258E211C|nr:uncharacterized protein LOC130808325 [Amaranthus tricolor]
MEKTIRTTAKETLGVSSGKPKVFQESWWWNNEMEKKIKDKNKKFKDFLACTEDEDRIEKRVSYKEAKRAAKKAVTEAKSRGYEDLYRKLDTKVLILLIYFIYLHSFYLFRVATSYYLSQTRGLLWLRSS